MKHSRGEFVRKLGCARLQLKRLNESLRVNDLKGLEDASAAIENLLVDLVHYHKRMSREDQQAVRVRFSTLRDEALVSLEIARRILDDSLDAMMQLLNSVQNAGRYGSLPPNSNIIIDRRA